MVALASTASRMMMRMSTAVSVIAGAVILKEPFTWLSAVFCAVILVGIYGVQKFARKGEPETIQNPIQKTEGEQR